MSNPQSRLVADRYRLLEPLGQGGMGRVWKARDEVLHRDVAIKELVPPPGLTDEERQEMRERSLREARAIARLNNVNVVRVFDVLRTDGDPWIVMEYVPSRSLHDVLTKDGPVGHLRAAEIGLGVLGALKAAHRAGVMHRDIKPGNVLLGEDGRVVLTDFGLATIPGDPNVTRTGLVLGSPAYIAPERAKDGTAGPRADLWSLGAMLYATVEGQSPYARPTAIATLAALATEPVPPPRNAGPLKGVLAGLLRKDPEQRMTADEAERQLRRIVHRRTRGGGGMSLLESVRRTAAEGRGEPSQSRRPSGGTGASAPSPRTPGGSGSPARGSATVGGAALAGGAAAGAAAGGAAAGAAAGQVAAAGAAPGAAGKETTPAEARAGAAPPSADPAAAPDDGRATSAPPVDAESLAAAGQIPAPAAPVHDEVPVTGAVATGADGAAEVEAPAGAAAAGAAAAGAAAAGAAAADASQADDLDHAHAGESSPDDADADDADLDGADAESPAPGGPAGPAGESAADEPVPAVPADPGVESDDGSGRNDRTDASGVPDRDGRGRTATDRAAVAGAAAGGVVGLPPAVDPWDTPADAGGADGAPNGAARQPDGTARQPDGAARPGYAPGRASTPPDATPFDSLPATGRAPITVPPPDEPRPARRRAMLLAGLLVVALVAGLVAFLVLRDPGGKGNNGPAAGPSQGGSASAPAGEASSAAGSPTAQTPSAAPTSAAPSVSASPPAASAQPGGTGFTPPAGWHMWSDPTGFKVPVPDGWSRRVDGEGNVIFVQPNGFGLLLIAQTRRPEADPVADWKSKEDYRRGHTTNYQRVGTIHAVKFWQKAADWEWLETRSGVRVHVRNRGFVTAHDQAYALRWDTRADDWDRLLPEFDNIIAKGFVPARQD
ncbi:protein kinase [Plantactinospora siamensis]|uniref:non-specific serine/threonine protein kinase n=1 Tax=Plantactinospora siamensis TaxID=555372 RepID=A0ABV6NZ13_9ACTN